MADKHQSYLAEHTFSARRVQSSVCPPRQRPPPSCHCKGTHAQEGPCRGFPWFDRRQGDTESTVSVWTERKGPWVPSPLGGGHAAGGCQALGRRAPGMLSVGTGRGCRGRGGRRQSSLCLKPLSIHPTWPLALSAAVSPEEGAQRAGAPAGASVCPRCASSGRSRPLRHGHSLGGETGDRQETGETNGGVGRKVTGALTKSRTGVVCVRRAGGYFKQGGRGGVSEKAAGGVEGRALCTPQEGCPRQRGQPVPKPCSGTWCFWCGRERATEWE